MVPYSAHIQTRKKTEDLPIPALLSAPREIRKDAAYRTSQGVSVSLSLALILSFFLVSAAQASRSSRPNTFWALLRLWRPLKIWGAGAFASTCHCWDRADCAFESGVNLDNRSLIELWSGYEQRHENHELASNTVLAVECYGVSGQSRLNVARPGYENIVSCLLSGPVPACQPPVTAHLIPQTQWTLSRHIYTPIFVVLVLGIGRYVSTCPSIP
ncbi:hypothetical protein N431DRAFT_103117 [Stipitochalara longipes BDJ]|nr:hypothetical protein N431DRAFT_103117 [Stipitochalara longipes BDJ]